ncbi:MAG: choice-of-anchor Q domain-containing protein [Planctomycetaceae bacterium]
MSSVFFLRSFLDCLRRIRPAAGRRHQRNSFRHSSPERLEDRALLATFTVTNLNDSGAGSLRQAVLDANAAAGPDAIDLTGVTGTITLTTGQLSVTEGVNISGPGADRLAISGNGASRIFDLSGAGQNSYTIENVDLTGGFTPDGGGAVRMIDTDDQLFLNHVLIRESQANGGGGLAVVGGTYQIRESAFVDNFASFGGGAILTQSSNGWIINSTVGVNTSNSGAGIVQQQVFNGETGVMRLRNVTLADSTGNGVLNFGDTTGSATLEISNTIIARSSGSNVSNTGTGVFNSIGSNISDDATAGFTASGDQTSTDPLLPQFALRNGNPTPTYDLPANSPAVDAGNAALAIDGFAAPYQTDQRLSPFVRITDGDGDGVAAIDVGAFELFGTLIVDSNSDVEDGNYSSGNFSLREAIAIANAHTGADTIRFASSLNGQTITLAGSELLVTDSLTINGPGAANLTISGGGMPNRVFNIDDANAAFLDVAFSGVTISHGGDGVATVHGAGISSRENLTLLNVVLSDNQAGPNSFGGAINHQQGTLKVTDSTSTRNTALTGASVFTAFARADFLNTLFSDNLAGSGPNADLEFRTGIVTLSNVTVDSRSGTPRAVVNYAAGAGQTSELYVTNSTFVGDGLGIVNFADAGSTAVSGYGNSIFSGFTNSVANGGAGVFDVTSSGFNIFQDTPTANSIASDRTNTDPQLGPLQDNGGPTLTRALLAGSPAIDAGDNSQALDLTDLTGNTPLTTDQRGTGFGRILDGDGNGTATVDIGAVEAPAAPSFSVTAPVGRITTVRPTISWTPVTGAQSYDVWVNVDDGGGNVFRQLGVSNQATSVSVNVDLEFARYRVFVYANMPTGQIAAQGHTFILDQQSQLTTIGATTAANPQFTFSRVPGASSYVLFVNLPGGPVVENVTDPGSGSTITHTLGTALPSNDYRWWVRPVRSNGWLGPWSERSEFSTGGRTRVTSPVFGSTVTTSPATLSWPAVPAAQSYEVYVSKTGTPGVLYRDAGITTSSISTRALQNGDYRVWIRTTLANGTGVWGSGVPFTVNQPTIAMAATPQAPSGPGFNASPVFVWLDTPGASSYDVLLHQGTSAQLLTGLTGTSFTPSAPLAAGEWTWTLRAVSISGPGTWSAETAFTTNGKTQLLTPASSTADRTPTFSWQTVSGATGYMLQVDNRTTGAANVIRENSLTTNSFTPTTSLTPGNYRAWVRAVSSTATGPWSVQYDFTVTDVSPSSELLSVTDVTLLASLDRPIVNDLKAATPVTDARQTTAEPSGHLPQPWDPAVGDVRLPNLAADEIEAMDRAFEEFAEILT